MQTLKHIEDELEKIESLRNKIREIQVTYQGKLKLEVAADLGLTFEQVNLPYAKWAAIRDPWLDANNRRG